MIDSVKDERKILKRILFAAQQTQKPSMTSSSLHHPQLTCHAWPWEAPWYQKSCRLSSFHCHCCKGLESLGLCPKKETG